MIHKDEDVPEERERGRAGLGGSCGVWREDLEPGLPGRGRLRSVPLTHGLWAASPSAAWGWRTHQVRRPLSTEAVAPEGLQLGPGGEEVAHSSTRQSALA